MTIPDKKCTPEQARYNEYCAVFPYRALEATDIEVEGELLTFVHDNTQRAVNVDDRKKVWKRCPTYQEDGVGVIYVSEAQCDAWGIDFFELPKWPVYEGLGKPNYFELDAEQEVVRRLRDKGVDRIDDRRFVEVLADCIRGLPR